MSTTSRITEIEKDLENMKIHAPRPGIVIYGDPKNSWMTDQIQVETDQAKRQALIDEAFKIHLEEVGHISLHQQPLSWGVSEKVDVAQRPDNVFDLRYAIVK